MPITRYTHEDLRGQLADRWEGTPFWTPADATDALNEAFALTNLLTGVWKRRVTQAATPGWDLALPASITYGMRIAFDGVPLASTGVFDLDNGRPGWRAETTAAGGDVPTVPLLWAPIDLQLVAIWPSPAASGSTWTIDGVANTPVLVYPEDVVDLGEDHLRLVTGCALHLAAFIEGSERFGQTRPHWLAFLEGCAQINTHLKRSSWYRRYLGLDRQRDFRPTRGGPTALDGVVAASAGGGS